MFCNISDDLESDLLQNIRLQIIQRLYLFILLFLFSKLILEAGLA